MARNRGVAGEIMRKDQVYTQIVELRGLTDGLAVRSGMTQKIFGLSNLKNGNGTD